MPTNRCQTCRQPLVREETLCDKCKGLPARVRVKVESIRAQLRNTCGECGLSSRNRIHNVIQGWSSKGLHHLFVPIAPE